MALTPHEITSHKNETAAVLANRGWRDKAKTSSSPSDVETGFPVGRVFVLLLTRSGSVCMETLERTCTVDGSFTGSYGRAWMREGASIIRKQKLA